jgi:hypothetical protein
MFMKTFLALALISLLFTLNGVAAGAGPEIRIIDNKVSIQAEAIPLSRLLRLFDQATGLTSKVPPELANRNVSVRFSNVTFDEAIRKIFEGQPLDYVFVEGRGIIVTGNSQTLTAARNTPGAPSAPPPQETMNEENNFPPFMPANGQQPQMGIPGAVNGANGAQNQPAMIQTPFGAIPNPRANQPQQGASPMVTPGQAVAPFNNGLPGFNNSNQLPTMQSTPAFGTPTTQPNSPFGTPTQPNAPFNNSPFNNTPQSYPNTVPNNGFPGITPQPRPNP